MKRLGVLLCLILTGAVTACADLVEPDYEIKFYLKNEVVLQRGKAALTDEVKDYFNIDETVKIVMQFLDAHAYTLYDKSWIVRIRNREDKYKLDISYKYRIPVSGTIHDALVEAERLGWDSSETKYDYQIDWSLTKQTLSITKKREEVDVSGVDEEAMELPTGNKARDAVIERMPGKLEKWGNEHFGIQDWAEDILEDAHIFGPVTGDRHVGSWSLSGHKPKIYIEIWYIADKTVVELSFKTDTYEEARILRDAMKTLLQNKGWLSQETIMKTQMILQAYGR